MSAFAGTLFTETSITWILGFVPMVGDSNKEVSVYTIMVN